MTETRSTDFQVVDRDGVHGTLELAAVPPDGKQSQSVLVRFRENAQVFVRSNVLVERKEGGYFYPHSFDEALRRASADSVNASTRAPQIVDDEELVVPLIAEELRVEKRQVERDAVRIHKTVSTRHETIDVPLMQEQTKVERIPVNRIVESAPAVRYEGDMMIVPILEEVIVVEKRLMLLEELRITKQRVMVSKPQTVTLRREEVIVEQVPPELAPAAEEDTARISGHEQREIDGKEL